MDKFTIWFYLTNGALRLTWVGASNKRNMFSEVSKLHEKGYRYIQVRDIDNILLFTVEYGKFYFGEEV